MDVVTSRNVAAPSGHFSQAVTVPVTESLQLMFLSGMTARDPLTGRVTGVGDVTAQTERVCESIKSLVETAGGTLDDVVRVDVFVRDINDFSAVHAVRRRYFGATPPASTMLEISQMVDPDMLIEITAVAAIRNLS